MNKNFNRVILLFLLGFLNPIINTPQVKANSDQWQVHECQSDKDADNNKISLPFRIHPPEVSFDRPLMQGTCSFHGE